MSESQVIKDMYAEIDKLKFDLNLRDDQVVELRSQVAGKNAVIFTMQENDKVLQSQITALQAENESLKGSIDYFTDAVKMTKIQLRRFVA